MTDVSEHPGASYRDNRLREVLVNLDEAVRVLTSMQANVRAAISPAGSDDDRAGGTFCARRYARMINDDFFDALKEAACTVQTIANADNLGYEVASPDAARSGPELAVVR